MKHCRPLRQRNNTAPQFAHHFREGGRAALPPEAELRLENTLSRSRLFSFVAAGTPFFNVRCPPAVVLEFDRVGVVDRHLVCGYFIVWLFMGLSYCMVVRFFSPRCALRAARQKQRPSRSVLSNERIKT